jgi:hypothetical protein
MEERRYRDRWKGENFSVSQIGFPSMSGRHGTLKTPVVLHDSACVALHHSIRCSEWKRTFSSSKVKGNIPRLGKNFQTGVIIGAMEDDILLD